MLDVVFVTLDIAGVQVICRAVGIVAVLHVTVCRSIHFSGVEVGVGHGWVIALGLVAKRLGVHRAARLTAATATATSVATAATLLPSFLFAHVHGFGSARELPATLPTHVVNVVAAAVRADRHDRVLPSTYSKTNVIEYIKSNIL